MQKLFQLFFTSKKHSISMGLLISKRIIESYGGYLEAKKNLKENVSFNFILPTEKGHTE